VQALSQRQALLEAYFRQGLTDAARAELRAIIDIRTAAGENAAGYDLLIPQLWENTLFFMMKQQMGQMIQQSQAVITKEIQDAGGKPGPELQRKIGNLQQSMAAFQQDPYTMFVNMKVLDEKDHPKNFYRALQSRGRADDEDGPTDNKVVEGLALRYLARLNELLTKDEQQLVENLKRSIPPGAPAADVFRAYIQNGLPMQAIQFFDKMPENSRDVSLQVMYMELLYRLGKIEQCHTEVFAPEAFDPAGQRDPQLVERLTVLRLQRELLLGDYFKADQTAVQLLQAQFIPLTEAEKRLATTELMNTQFAVGQLMGMLPFLEYERQRGVLVSRLAIEANLTFRRGVLCLLRSDLAEAKRLFDLAAAPQGIPLEKLGLPESLDMTVLLPKYRELLKKYAK
jgi:hypothetical protein